MWGWHDGMGWWMVFGFFWLLLFWIAFIWLFVRVTGVGGGPERAPPREDSAIEIARRRYARGEISREDFEQIRRDLES